MFFLFCPTAHENRRGGKPKEVISFTWIKRRHQQIHMVRQHLYSPLFLAPEPRLGSSGRMKWASGTAGRVCWQMFFWCKMLTAIVAVNRRHSAGEHRRFCPLTITARRRWSLLSLICIGISNISIPDTTEEQTRMDWGVKGALRPRHISSNQ